MDAGRAVDDVGWGVSRWWRSGVNSSDHAVTALDTLSDTPVIISPPSSAAAGTVACASGSPPDSVSSTRRSPTANQSSSAIPAPSTGSPMPAAASIDSSRSCT